MGTRSAPLVAVPTYHLAAGRVLDWARGGYAVPDDYVAAVVRAGGRPVLLPPCGALDAGPALDGFDALVLAGGGDVEPARYGGRPHPAVYGVDPARDEAELVLVRVAMDAGLAVLAICRGIQIMNVALGGTLHQHLPELQGMDLHGHPTGTSSVVHDVALAPGTRVAKACGVESLRCVSHHHQGIDRLGAGLVSVAWSADGLVEAVEPSPPGTGWTVGVQWHPEMSAADDEHQQALFDELVAQAGR